jgi:solute carrier family 25 phosphate transporter 23/24/25/41
VRKAFGLFGSQGIFAEFSESWGRSERHAATAVNFDGDVSLAGEERKKVGDDEKEAKREARRAERNAMNSVGGGGGGEEKGDEVSASTYSKSVATPTQDLPTDDDGQTLVVEHDEGEEEEEDSDMIHGMVAVKFLLAGGIAGAVSRTATAPFDRLKIYLITTARTTATGKAMSQGVQAATSVDATAKMATQGMGLLKEAIWALYREGGGLKAFWIGNGLNCLKIFPESAIKFLSYEMSKRAFAKYRDGVSDSRDISGSSRFMSGGIGGITSQLAIYPVETLKTRLMSSQGGRNKGNALLAATARDMWKNGGLRTYYRGLTAGLIGVFPYSAIDMSTFEGIKLFWIRYTGREEPSVLSLLAFGSISGSVGATTVYPLK